MDWNDFLRVCGADALALVTALGGDWGLVALGGIYSAMIALEWLGYRLFKRTAYDGKECVNNIVVNLINTGFDVATSGVAPLALYVWTFEHARFVAHLHAGLAVGLAFVGHEIAYYVDHRMGHRIGLFWAFHQVHHSSRAFNFPVAARGFLIDGNLILHSVALPLAFCGVSPVIWLGMHGLKSIYGIFNHADFVPKLGVLEEFIATPANHRAHHGIQAKYIDKNFSQVTVILDRLLGTFQREEERAIVGLKTPFLSRDPIKTEMSGLVWLRDRMRSAERWQDKLKYLWKPPEWRHCEERAVRDEPAPPRDEPILARSS